MSRLIFEGDTRERFGSLFPKPFIQEMRVFDNNLSIDIALYFEIEEDVEVADFLADTGMNNLKIFVGPAFEEIIRERGSTGGDLDGGGIDFIRYSVAQDVFAGLFSPNGIDDYSSYTLGLSDYRTQFFYNSEGKKFIKFVITDEISENYKQYASNLAGQSTFIIAATFFEDVDVTLNQIDTNNSILANKPLYEDQFSEISYEKLFNPDGTLAIDRQVVYRQGSGNIYNAIPVQSLDNNYRESNNMTHRQIASIINSIIQPFIGSITEADRVSTTLSEYMNNPELLKEIQKDIKSFSNKSSATPTGQLYGNLVDAVVSVDSVLQSENIVNKRFEFMNKIKDRRNEFGDFEFDNTSETPFGYLDDSNYIYGPLVTRRIISAVDVPVIDTSDVDSFAVLNKSYLFFDYQKALNYRSQISEIFNTYNIETLMGRNCLNPFFEIEKVLVKKYSVDESNPLEAVIYFDKDQGGVGFMFQKSNFSSAAGRRSKNLPQLPDYADVDSEVPTFFSSIVERAFRFFDVEDTNQKGLADYRLKFYEIKDLSTLRQSLRGDTQYVFEFVINDRTMMFYEQFLRSKIAEVFARFATYAEYTQQFCSYNNIDESFNDFFVTAVEAEFEEPYPWHEGPLIYYSLLALLENSYDKVGGRIDVRTANRKRDGGLLDLEKIKNLAIVASNTVSPTSGNLESVREFLQQLEVIAELFEKGEALDTIGTIYKTTEDGYELNKSSDMIEILKTYDLVDPIINSLQVNALVAPKLSFNKNSEDSDDFLSFSQISEIFGEDKGPLPDAVNPSGTAPARYNRAGHALDDLANNGGTNILDYPFFAEAGWEILFENEVYDENLQSSYSSNSWGGPTVIEQLRNNTKQDLKILIPTILKMRELKSGNRTLRDLLEQYGSTTYSLQGYDEDNNPV